MVSGSMLRRTNTNFTASQAHQDNDVASPRVTNTVVTQSSTDQLSQNNCNTEKTLTDAKPVKSTNKKKLYETHPLSMDAPSTSTALRRQIDISFLEHCWRAIANGTSNSLFATEYSA
jgi:hypothetical protein